MKGLERLAVDTMARTLLAVLLLAGCGGEGGSGETDTDTDGDTDASASDFTASRSASDSNSGPPSTFTNTSDSDSGSDSQSASDSDSESGETTDGGSEETGTSPTSSGSTSSDSSTSGTTDESTDGTTTGDLPGAGDCCSTHDDPGCSVSEVESCVCEEDPVCCEVFWDEACTVKVMALGCGECPGIGGDGDCCADNGTPGCDDDAIENCVCLQDIACCLESWDSVCAQGVELYECGQC